MRKMSALVLFLMVSALVVPAVSFAEHDGKQCSMKSKDCDHGDCKDCDGYKCPITEKIMKKAKFFLENQKEIGLSEEQVTQIKAIKMETKKGYIRASADMEIFELDLKEKLSQPTLDVEGLNAMLDQASSGWGTGAKAGVASYAKLKAVLNEQQMSKAKEIWMRGEKK